MSLAFNRFTFLILIFAGALFLSPLTVGQEATETVTVEFDTLWIDYDVTQDGIKGMLIHTSFTVRQMQNIDGYLTIRIQDENDEALKSPTQGFRNKGGELAIFRSFKPAYIDAIFKDLSVFLPYGEIKLASGKYELKIDADLIYENGDFIQHLTLHAFTFTQPETSDGGPSETANVQFNQLWVDNNVTRDGQLGMLIHVNVALRQLMGVPSSLAVAVEFKNGDKVFAGNPEYRSTNGQLTVYRTLNNRFDSSLYTDLQLFIPYREFSVGAGSQELRLHVDILYGDGGNLHVTYHDFSFTK